MLPIRVCRWLLADIPLDIGTILVGQSIVALTKRQPSGCQYKPKEGRGEQTGPYQNPLIAQTSMTGTGSNQRLRARMFSRALLASRIETVH